MEREGLGKIEDPEDRVKTFDAVAMINARFLAKSDYRVAEEYIDRALMILDSVELERREAAI